MTLCHRFIWKPSTSVLSDNTLGPASDSDALALVLLWLRWRSVLDLWLMVVLRLAAGDRVFRTPHRPPLQPGVLCEPHVCARHRECRTARLVHRNGDTLWTSRPVRHATASQTRGPSDGHERDVNFNRAPVEATVVSDDGKQRCGAAMARKGPAGFGQSARRRGAHHR